ncbi:DivIVA domain-containing protein [Micromonospora sp. NBC_00421]|uniref:DivIVA domain-containing protein n=1 Tax=Micromonospora sp. NBC_00421 TaxID=2975976 RepID=UPI002E1FF0E4
MRILLSLFRSLWPGRPGRSPWPGRSGNCLWRRRAERRRPQRPPNGGWYRSEVCRPLTARQVQERQFGLVKRGLDPVEVDAFLHRVAADLAKTRRDLAIVREENQRIKSALRSWRTHFTSDVRW